MTDVTLREVDMPETGLVETLTLEFNERRLVEAIRKYSEALKTANAASLALKSAQTDMEAAMRDVGINLTK